MTIQKLIGAGLVLISIGGCGTLYVPPSGTATVDVHLINNTNGLATAAYYAGTEKCTEPKPVAGIQPAETGDIRLPADHAITLMYGTTESHWPEVKGCIPIVSFQPHIGSSYTVEIHNDESECYLNLKEIRNGVSSPVRFVPRTFKRPFLRSQGFCPSLTNEERASLHQ